jgi:adenylate cyclase
MSVSEPSYLSSAQLVEVPALEVRAELESIKASRVFVDAIKLQEFLTYVVDETLAGRAGRIKGYSVAKDVFHRENSEDAQTSTIVRVEAGRLRRRLIEYYSGEGRSDVVRIEIPKGGYVPRFERVPASVGEDFGRKQNEKNDVVDANPKILASRWRWALGVTLTVGLVLFGAWVGQQGQSGGSGDVSLSLSTTTPSIVVLPFTNASGGELTAQLAQGLTEDIVTDLSKVHGIDVIAMPSARIFSGSGLSPREVGTKLGVSYVLKGDIRGEYPETRVTARLYDSNNNRQLWASRFDRNASDILAVQDELAGRVVQEMSAGLTATTDAAADSLIAGEARALYRQAMDLANPPGDEARLAAASQALTRAIEIDPSYANAIAGLAYVNVFNVLFNHSATPGDDLDRSRQLAEKALSINPTVGLAHTTMAFHALIDADHEGALEMSSKAVDVQPGSPYLNTYHAYLLAINGRAAAGIPYAEYALQLDPLNTRSPYMNILGFVRFYAEDYQGALDAYVSNRERGGPFGAGHQAYIVASLVALKKREEALVQLEVLRANGGESNWAVGPSVNRFKNSEDQQKLSRIIDQFSASAQ